MIIHKPSNHFLIYITIANGLKVVLMARIESGILSIAFVPHSGTRVSGLLGFLNLKSETPFELTV